MAPSHLWMDARVITSFTRGFDQEHIYQMATITIYNLISLLEILKMLLKRISIPTNAFTCVFQALKRISIPTNAFNA